MTKSEKKDEKDSLTDNKIASKKSKLSEETDTSTKEKTIEEKLNMNWYDNDIDESFIN